MSYHHKCATIGCIWGAKPGDAFCKTCMVERIRGHVSPSKDNPMVKQETIAVPVELVREIHAVMDRPVAHLAGGGPLTLAGTIPGDLRGLILRALPKPKPDVIEECARAYREAYRAGEYQGAGYPPAITAALRRYRELGCPELDEP